MKNYRSSESVNAGSMADIAFLLLIFFLVSTTISSGVGIKRELPKPCANPEDCVKTIAEHNMFFIRLNSSNEILVDDSLVDIDQLQELITNFVDNNGDDSCTYCNGNQSTKLSDNPKKAFVVIEHNRQTPFEVFIKVQDETTKAIMQLRNAYSLNRYDKMFSELNDSEKIIVKKAYPINMSEIIK